MNYGKAIKTVRSAKGISQKKLSKDLQLDPSYLSRIERGERIPSASLLEDISKKLGIPFYLLTLLSSDKEDLQNTNTKEIERISKNLLLALLEK